MNTNEKGDASDLQVTVLRAVRVVFKTRLCQFAPVPWGRARDDVFYFPEAMLTEAIKRDKVNSRGFGAHIWASMYILDTQVAEIVNDNVRLIVEQYLSGRRSHFGPYLGASLKDSAQRLALRNVAEQPLSLIHI